MKINWKARMKNPYFWVGLVAVVMTAVGVSPETFTSWEILRQQLWELLGNPFLLGTALLAVLGVLTDPSTKGLSDEKQTDRKGGE